MPKTKTVRLGNRRRKWLNVQVPVSVLRTNADGTLVTDGEGDPVADEEVRTYRVPLRGSLRSGELLLFRSPDGGEQSNLDAVYAFHQFLCRYIPADVVDELDMDDINAFYEAWDEASREEDGLTQGE